MKPFKLLLAAAICFNYHSYALAADAVALDKAVQKTLNHYLSHAGKAEGVTGISATIRYPDQNQIVTNNVAVGVMGFPPLNTEQVTPDNLFQIGSITKSFVAAIILQLEAEGKLSINDKIGKWFPEYPNWQDVTIKQLLNMTSGIPSYTKNIAFLEKVYADIHLHLTTEELLTYASPEKPIKVGKNKFDYSNTNYILAGMIIEKTTKSSLEEALQTRLFTPFGLTNTYYPVTKEAYKKILPRVVHGYYHDEEDSKKMIDITTGDLSWAGAAGAIVANTQDISTWVNVLYHGLFVPEKSRARALAELESIVSMKTGKPITKVTAADPKGFGLGIGRIYQPSLGQFWLYEGSSMGYRVRYIWRQCNDVSTVAALNNKAGDEHSTKNGGSHSQALVVDLYKDIIANHPQLACKD